MSHFDFLLDDISFECWVYPTSHPTNAYLVSKSWYNAAAYRYGIHLYNGAPRIFTYGSSGGSGDNIVCASSTVLDLNTWTHLAFTVDRDGTSKIYINGILDTTGPQLHTFNMNNSINYRLGAYTNSDNTGVQPDFFLQGKIAEVRLWRKVLSEAEIQSKMYRRLTFAETSDTDLIHYLKFEDVSFPSLISDGTNTRGGNIPQTTSLVPSEGLTLSLWSKRLGSDSGDYWTIAGIIGDPTEGTGSSYQIQKNHNSTDYRFYIRTNGVAKLITCSPPSLNVWSHLVLTYDRSFLRAWIDGIEVASLAETGAIDASTNNFHIGYSTNNRFHSNTENSDIQLYNRALTAQEIATISNHEIIDDGSLMGRWLAEPLNGSTIVDSLGSNDGTVVAGTTTGSLVIKDAGQDSSSYAKHGTVYSGSVSDITGEIVDPSLPVPVAPDKYMTFPGTTTDYAINESFSPGNIHTIEFKARIVGGAVNSNTQGIIQLSNDNSMIYITTGDITSYANSETILIAHHGSSNSDYRRTYIQTELDDQWHHIAMSWNGSSYVIYIDGVAQSTLAASTYGHIPLLGSEGLVTRMQLGFMNTHYTPNGFNGDIDEIRIWSTSRTAQEILDNKDARLTGGETGLIALWNFDNATSSVIPDEAGSNDLTIVGSPVFTEVVIPDPPVSDPVEYYMNFDGNDYINTDTKVVTSNNQPFTFEGWFRVPAYGGASYYSFFSHNSLSGSYEGPGITHTGTGVISFFTGGTGYMNIETASNAFPLNTWFHLAITYDGSLNASGMKIIVDGVDTGASVILNRNSTSNDSIPSNFQIANRAGGYIFNGDIRDIRAWNVVRTIEEINASKDSFLQGNETGLVINYTFSEGIGTPVSIPSVGTTIVGNPTWEYFNEVKAIHLLSEHYTIQDSPELNPDSFTLMCWVYMNSSPQYTFLISKYDWYSGGAKGFGLVMYNQGTLSVEGHSTTPDSANSTAAYSVPLSKWFHVAVSYDSGTTNFYIDGELFDSVNMYIDHTPVDILFGSYHRGGVLDAGASTRNWYMNNVQYWNRALSQAEIHENAHKTLVGDEQNLIGYWPCTDEDATRLTDLTINANHAIGSSYDYVAGKQLEVPNAINKAVDFTGGYLSMGVVDYNNGPLTVECWINPHDINQDAATIWGFSESYSTGNMFTFQIYLGDIRLGSYTMGWNGGFFTNTKPVNNQWMHVAVVFEGNNNAKMYVNGVLDTTITGTLTFSALATSFYAGSYFRSGSPQTAFDGEIAELRVWKELRTEQQIQDNLYKPLQEYPSTLVGYWPLNGLENSVYPDKSFNGNDATPSGSLSVIDIPGEIQEP